MIILPSILIMTLTLLVSTGGSLLYRGHQESYMSDVSLERFYLLEENVMSNADVLVKEDYFGLDEEETEQQHRAHALNMTEIQNTLYRAKDLHREVGPDLGHFLGHPINVLHLFRRLKAEWKKGLDVLLKTTPCKLWKISAMRRYLAFLRDNIPGDEDVKVVVKQLARLHSIYGNPTRDVAEGRIGNIQAIEPLSVEEQYTIGAILYDEEEIPAALSWFELVNDWMKTASGSDVKELSFNKADLFAKMASGYYTIGKLDEAVDVANKHLDLDKSNSRVLENLNFFLMKQMMQQVDGPSKRTQESVGARPTTKMQRICAGHVFKPSRKVCVLEPVHGPIGWHFYKKEILRHKPAINLYHNVITDFTMDQLKDYAHSKLTNKAWISSSVFITPQMGTEIIYSELPKKKSIRYSAQKLAQAFMRVPGRNEKLLKGWGRMQIFNAGRTGTHLSKYDRDFQLRPVKKIDKGLGAMFAFLSEPQQGGEIVMKSRQVFSPAPKGSILVYDSTQSKLHSLCPALGGSQWVAVQPFYERDPKICARRRYPWV